MDKFLNELKRYCIIYFMFAKNCILSQMEYRVNFIFGCMIETAFLAVKVLYLIVIYNIGVNIKGYSPDVILLFVGTYTAMTGIYVMLFWQNFADLPECIRTGTLDMYMVKPISLQFISTFRHVDFGLPIPNIIGGVVMIVIGWKRVGIEVGFVNIIGFLGFMFTGVLLTYSIFLLPQLIAFWTVKTGGNMEVSNALWDFNNMPMAIYNKWIQRVGVFILPVLIITNFPALFVLKGLKNVYFIYGLVSPIVFLIITRVVWSFAVKRYTSASS